MTELVRYEAARRALAEAVAVDEVLDVRSKAEALRHYARQAGDRDLEIQSAQLRFRAERRLGEMLVEQKATVGLAKGGQPYRGDSTAAETEAVERLPTLREVGIDHKLSSKAQRVAAMDAAEFEQALARHAEEMRAGQGRVAMDLLKIGAEERGREHRRNLAAGLSEASAALPSGRQFPCAYIDLPWERQGGIGNRAYENHYPTMSWPEILTFLRGARDVLLPDSWAFFWIPRAHLLALVEIELEVTIAATGEIVPAKVDMPLAWACAQALGMDSYSTCFVWTKTDEENPDASGTGLIAWDQDELLLLFKRGRGLPKPAGSEKFGSNHRERAREHSRKPEHYRRMIAAMTGGLPVLEMFARVDAAHPLPEGWAACGNQAAVAPAAIVDEPALEADEVSPEGLPSAGENVTAAADATSQRANPAAAVTDNSELPAFPPSELAELQLFQQRLAEKDLARADAIAPEYVTRGLVHNWLGQWRLTPQGEVRLQVVKRERVERHAAAERCLSSDEFVEWRYLESVPAQLWKPGEQVRHLVGEGLANVTTDYRVNLTERGVERLAELDEIVDHAAAKPLTVPAPASPIQLELVQFLQKEVSCR